jgi:hypothetical protein
LHGARYIPIFPDASPTAIPALLPGLGRKIPNPVPQKSPFTFVCSMDSKQASQKMPPPSCGEDGKPRILKKIAGLLEKVIRLFLLGKWAPLACHKKHLSYSNQCH